MEVLYLLIFFSTLLGLFFLVAFIWAVKNGQFEDVDTPSKKIIIDNDNQIK